jgi:hypothetical protein
MQYKETSVYCENHVKHTNVGIMQSFSVIANGVITGL